MATQQAQSNISEVSICNQALSWIGAGQINSLDDPSRAAEWCRNNYPFLRDAVLEERMWSFAQGRAVSTVADRDAWDLHYTHPIPLEWLYVYRVYNNPQNLDTMYGDEVKWYREGDDVLTECDTVYMWGIKRIVDTGKFTNLFVQALAARMAADAAIPFTENRQLQDDMWGLYLKKLKDAAARDGQQGDREHVRTRRLVGSRLGNRGSI